MIQEVRDINNVFHNSNSIIGVAFIDHYSSIFKSKWNGDDDDALSTVDCVILKDEALLLVAPYSAIDVKSTLDTMYLDKSPDLME